MLGTMGCRLFRRKDPTLDRELPPWSGHLVAFSIRALESGRLEPATLLPAHRAAVPRPNRPARKKLSTAKDRGPHRMGGCWYGLDVGLCVFLWINKSQEISLVCIS